MTNAELLDALNRLDELFSDESRWTKGSTAKDSEGRVVMAEHPDAVCWCLYGGALRVGLHAIDANDLWEQMIPDETTSSSVGLWNDAPERTFADVKRLIADTRARLEAA